MPFIVRNTMRSGIVALLLFTAAAVARAESITVAGHGELSIPSGTDPQLTINAAQSAARADALTQAIYRVCGGRARLGPKSEEVIRGVIDHSATILLDIEVKGASADNGRAIVDIAARIDPKALQEYVEENFGLMSAQETQTQFRMFVLSYTVEGMDPNRSQPQVLREEVTEDNKNVHASSEASSATLAEKSSSSASLQKVSISRNRGSEQRSESASLKGAVSTHEAGALSARDADSSLRAGYHASGSANVDARAASSQSAQWDKHSTPQP